MSGVELRYYQRDAIAAVDDAESRGRRRVIVQLPTGAGKTIVFSEMIRRRLEQGPALILAHRDELIDQAAEKLRRLAPELGTSIGRVKGPTKQIGYPVVVASVQTLARPKTIARAASSLKRFKTVIVDECHHAAADSYLRILEAVDPAALVAGFTATAERHDKRRLDDVFEEIVYARSIEEMVREGFLVPPKGHRIHAADLDLGDVKQNRGDFSASDLGAKMEDAGAVADVVQAFEEHAKTRKQILFAPTVALAKEMADAFNEAGFRSTHIDGKTEAHIRRNRLKAFANDEIQVLTNVGVLTEGFDDPSLDSVAIAAPTRSRIKYTQMIGRGLRLHPGKEDCLVLDLAGASDELTIQSLPGLFGLDHEPQEGESLLDAIDRERIERENTEAEKRDRVNGLREEQERRKRARRNHHASKIGFFSRDRLHWRRLKGRWILEAADDELLVLDERPDGSWWVLLLSDKRARPVQRNLDLGYAQGVAEEVVRHRKAIGLNDKKAGWRRKKPSDGQLGMLRRLGVTAMPATAGDASDAITLAKAEARLRRFDKALARREAAQSSNPAEQPAEVPV